MIITGNEKFNYTSDVVWEALHNPDILKRIIPGCESLNLTGEGEYEVVLKLGIAAVKGEYVGKVKIDDVEEPVYYVLHAEGSGAPGFVKVKMDCKFNQTESGCQLDWECDAEIGGKIAGVGSRVLTGISKYMAGKFFKDISKQIKQNQ